MTGYQNQSKQVMKVRLPYYGNNQCEPTELFLTISGRHNPFKTTKQTTLYAVN